MNPVVKGLLRDRRVRILKRLLMSKNVACSYESIPRQIAFLSGLTERYLRKVRAGDENLSEAMARKLMNQTSDREIIRGLEILTLKGTRSWFEETFSVPKTASKQVLVQTKELQPEISVASSMGKTIVVAPETELYNIEHNGKEVIVRLILK